MFRPVSRRPSAAQSCQNPSGFLRSGKIGLQLERALERTTSFFHVSGLGVCETQMEMDHRIARSLLDTPSQRWNRQVCEILLVIDPAEGVADRGSSGRPRLAVCASCKATSRLPLDSACIQAKIVRGNGRLGIDGENQLVALTSLVGAALGLQESRDHRMRLDGTRLTPGQPLEFLSRVVKPPWLVNNRPSIA